MKPSLFLYLCPAFLFVAIAHAESAGNPADSPPRAHLTLAAVTEAVVAGNPALLAARAKWEAMKQRVPQAAAWEDPKLSAESKLARFVDISRNGFADQMLSAEQTMPLSGRNRSRERMAAAEAVAAFEETRRKEFDAVSKARAAYFALGKAEALLELTGSDEISLQQLLDAAGAKFEVGGQSQADLLTAQNELSEIADNRHELMRQKSEAETQLNILMNRDPFAPLGKVSLPPFRPAALSLAALRAAVLAHRPEIQMAEAGLARARAELEFARREWIPDPALSVQAQRYNGAAQAVSEVDLGVSIDLPWVNGKKYRAEEREAESGVEAARSSLDEARLEGLGLLRDQLERIETLAHHLDLSGQRLIPNAREVLEANRANYQSGRITFADLLGAQRLVWEAEAMARQNAADYQAALAELESLTGGDLGLFGPREEH